MHKIYVFLFGGLALAAAFGIRGIKLIVDGIPETTPDGQGQLDNLPLALLSSIEIIRGQTACALEMHLVVYFT